MSIQVQALQELSEERATEARSAIERIFFESSNRQSFDNPLDRTEFFRRWTDYYLKLHPSEIYLAFNDSKQVLGYIMGTSDSLAAVEFYRERIPSYLTFADLFKRFPAHIHINCAAEARGQGVGSLLIQHFVRHCQETGVAGVHLVTSPNSRNVSFYERNGFSFREQREFKNYKLLFMARSLLQSS